MGRGNSVSPAERALGGVALVLDLEAAGDAVAVEEVAALGQLLHHTHHALQWPGKGMS